jgi:hypothetical protein
MVVHLICPLYFIWIWANSLDLVSLLHGESPVRAAQVLARFLCPVPTLASRFYAPRILPDYRPGVAHLGSWFWQQASVSVLYFVFRTSQSSVLLLVAVEVAWFILLSVQGVVVSVRESSQLEKQKQIKKQDWLISGAVSFSAGHLPVLQLAVFVASASSGLVANFCSIVCELLQWKINIA